MPWASLPVSLRKQYVHITNNYAETIAGVVAPLINGQFGTTNTLTVTVTASGAVEANAMACSATPASEIPTDLSAQNDLATKLFGAYLDHVQLNYADGVEVVVDRDTGNEDTGFKIKVNIIPCGGGNSVADVCGEPLGVCTPNPQNIQGPQGNN